MARSLINGGEQIASGTVPLSALVTGYSIPTANLADGSKFIKNDGTVAMAAALNLNSYTVQNSGNPTNASDLVTKAYVDAKVSGFSLFGARLLEASNQTSLSGLGAHDSVTPVDGNIVLLINQSTASQNGPWVLHSGSWTRPTWWPSGGSVPEGAYFLIESDGTTYGDTKYWCTNTGTIIPDTTSTTFLRDSSGISYTNGTGLGLIGTTFSVTYGTTSGTAAQGNDSRITGALQTSNMVWNEVPSGSINSSNTSFTIAHAPASSGSALNLYLNGQRMLAGSGNDFTISSTTITMLFAPQTGDQLIACYNY